MATTTTPTTASTRRSSANGSRRWAALGLIAAALAAGAGGCYQPRLFTGLRFHEASAGYSTGGPPSVQEIVQRFPALDGIVITAPDFLEELAELRKQREAEGVLAETEDYRLSTGASIRIEIAGEEELNRDFTIGPTGVIDYAYIGEIEAKGRTLREVREDVRSRMTQYVRDPKVSINLITLPTLTAVNQLTAGDIIVITQARSQTFNFTGDERISQVLASVDAMTDRHEWRQVRVIRRPGPGSPGRMVLVDMWRFVNMADLRQDIPLAAGDIVYVPRHWTFGDQFEQDADILLDYFQRTYEADAFVRYLEGLNK